MTRARTFDMWAVLTIPPFLGREPGLCQSLLPVSGGGRAAVSSRPMGKSLPAFLTHVRLPTDTTAVSEAWDGVPVH